MPMLRAAAAGFVGAGLLAACSSGAPGSSSGAPAGAALASGCRSGSGVSAQATTKDYVIELVVGSPEPMYSRSQVASQHPRSGEVMLRGQMATMPGMQDNGGHTMAGMPGMSGTAPASDHHLEAHICSRSTGAVVQDANPTITVVDDATRSSQHIPVAVMEGVGQGVADYHYGNNAVMAPGNTYTVAVSLNGETATFHIHMPSS